MGKHLTFYPVNVTDKESLEGIFKKHEINGVIHLSGLHTGEEQAEYDRNDTEGSKILFKTMRNHGVKKLVFSSSALVYGDPQFLPVTEKHCVGKHHPDFYTKSKYVIENAIKDICAHDHEWKATILRYYNAAGADESGIIGDDPAYSKNNLFRDLAEAASGKKNKVAVKRGEFDNIDGKSLNDFVHVTDVALGHVLALEKMAAKSCEGLKVYNLGHGRGISVAEVIENFSVVSGKALMYELLEEDDRVPGRFADATLAKQELLWRPEKTVRAICRSYLNWYKRNPNGYSNVKM